MTLASWFSSMRPSHRLTQNGARRNRLRAFRRRATFEAVEDRLLLSTVSFSTAGERVNESAGSFTIPVTLSGGAPTISPFASGINEPAGMAFGPDGDLYVTDGEDHTVEKVTPAGQVTTFASGFRGSDVFATPSDLAFNSEGDLFVADSLETTLSEVSPSGQVTTFASGFDEPESLVFDSAGNLYVANAGKNTVSKVTPAGNVTTFATGLNAPDAMAIDSAGNLFVSCGEIRTVYKITPAGNVSTFVSGIGFADALAVDAAGNLYVADGGSTVSEVTPAGTVNSLASGLNGPDGLAFDAAGNLYVANGGGTTVVKLSRDVTVPFDLGGSAVSGVDYSGVTASPLTFGIGQTTRDITGTLRSDPNSTRTLTFTLGTPTGGAVLGSPSVNTLTINQSATVQFSASSEIVNVTAGTFSIPVTVSGTPAGTPTVFPYASGFDEPDGLAVSKLGDVFVADAGNGTVREVTATGAVFIFAGFNAPAGMTFDSAGNLFVADAGDGSVREITQAGTVSNFATGFNHPDALAFDAAGNLYVASFALNTVLKVTPAGVVSRFASGFNEPDGLAFDSTGNLYVASAGNGTVKKVSPAGQVSTYAAGFNNPDGLALDAHGNLYVASAGNGTVSEVTPAGVVNIFASGLSAPDGLALDSHGNLYIANAGNNSVSQVAGGFTVPFTLSGIGLGAVVGVTASPLAFRIGQTTQDITGTLVNPELSELLILTLTLGTPTGGAVLGSPSANMMTIIEPPVLNLTTPTRVSPVFLGEQRVFSGKGKHKKLTGFEFLFNGALNAGSAQSTGNYHVTQKQGKKAKVLRVKSALYNSSDFSVTISVSGFNTGKPAQVNITGLAGADGATIPQVVTSFRESAVVTGASVAHAYRRGRRYVENPLAKPPVVLALSCEARARVHLDGARAFRPGIVTST
jgi:sugar lactone lactonase YvrE